MRDAATGRSGGPGATTGQTIGPHANIRRGQTNGRRRKVFGGTSLNVEPLPGNFPCICTGDLVGTNSDTGQEQEYHGPSQPSPNASGGCRWFFLMPGCKIARGPWAQSLPHRSPIPFEPVVFAEFVNYGVRDVCNSCAADTEANLPSLRRIAPGGSTSTRGGAPHTGGSRPRPPQTSNAIVAD